MRISSPDIRFHEANRGGATEIPGWFISANDADLDNQVVVVGSRKITPQQALRIAAVFDEVLSENVGRPVAYFTRGVADQNAWARVQAASAAKVSAAAAENARVRADALAAWDAPPTVTVDLDES